MSALALTKQELRVAVTRLESLYAPGPRPLSAEDSVEVSALVGKLRAMAAHAATALVRGAKVLEWRIPNAHAPTMNQYAFMKNWQRKNLRKELDEQLLKLIERTPGALVHGDRTQRWVRVTRWTTVPASVDSIDPDGLGGKMALDSLVRLGVLVDDTPALCRREGLARKTKMGNTHVCVEVYAMAIEEVADDGPHDAVVVQPPRKTKKAKGLMTKAILGGAK